MYDHFVGRVCEKAAARAVLLVSGIGYELQVPLSTSAGLKIGDEATLHTILHVVDGNPTLLGFRNPRERELARRLMTVTGVGPKVALAMLSTYGPHDIAQAILQDEPATLQKVKGVGAKTAERLCLELRDHIAKLDFLSVARDAAESASGSATDGDTAVDDAIAALVTLGYSDKDARSRTDKARKSTPDASTEDLIKTVLRG